MTRLRVVALCALASSAVANQGFLEDGIVVHEITAPDGEASWKPLCAAEPCAESYAELGNKPVGVHEYDATVDDYYPVVRVGHVLRFHYDDTHDVTKMADGCAGGGVVVEAGGGTLDYVVTLEDLETATLTFASSSGDDCRLGQRVDVIVSPRCDGGGMAEACQNLCSTASHEYTCWQCADGYELQDEEYRCRFYNCEGKCIKSEEATPEPSPGAPEATPEPSPGAPDAATPEPTAEPTGSTDAASPRMKRSQGRLASAFATATLAALGWIHA